MTSTDDLVALIPDLKNYAALENLYSAPEELDVGKGTYNLSTINDLSRFWDDNLRTYCLLSRSLCFTYDEVYSLFSIPFVMGSYHVNLLPENLKHALCFGSVKETRDIARYGARNDEESLITPFLSGKDDDDDTNGTNADNGLTSLISTFASLFSLTSTPKRVQGDIINAKNDLCEYSVTSIELVHNSTTPYICLSILLRIQALIVSFVRDSDSVIIDDKGNVCVFETHSEADKLKRKMSSLASSTDVESGDKLTWEELYLGCYTFPDLMRSLVLWYRHKYPPLASPICSPGTPRATGFSSGGVASPQSVNSTMSHNSEGSDTNQVDNDRRIVDILARWCGEDASTMSYGSDATLVNALCRVGFMERLKVYNRNGSNGGENDGNTMKEAEIKEEDTVLLINITRGTKDSAILSANIDNRESDGHYNHLLSFHYAMLQLADVFLTSQRKISDLNKSIREYGKSNQRGEALKQLDRRRKIEQKCKMYSSQFNELIKMKEAVTDAKLQIDIVKAMGRTKRVLKEERKELHNTLQHSLSRTTGDGQKGTGHDNKEVDGDDEMEDILHMISDLHDEFDEEMDAVKEIEGALLGQVDDDLENDMELQRELDELMEASRSKATATGNVDTIHATGDIRVADIPVAPTTAVDVGDLGNKESKAAVAT